MSHLAYTAMLVFCLVGTVPLVPVFGLRRVRPRRVLLTAVCAGAPFLVWDIAAARAGQWSFDARQTLPVRLLGLPLEEYAFFLVIPFAAIATYEAVGVMLRRRNGARPPDGRGR
ncbi:lycopene cyclase domain-containing protein [Leekyejoonella antrihumi]|uniref:Lycopene cyclase domain-containing protein n=1 Tax=Leekyejoonella antrihumi TaxID=1660198 RepID=A0A563E3Z4_9MICO|nr:lycopene cyclase domain-containing protein [Leekyejoonella antrihumi]TWP36963.1 lycopene cyclase domain-containing protein [Leekyejoonella antrihumi]